MAIRGQHRILDPRPWGPLAAAATLAEYTPKFLDGFGAGAFAVGMPPETVRDQGQRGSATEAFMREGVFLLRSGALDLISKSIEVATSGGLARHQRAYLFLTASGRKSFEFMPS